MTASYYLTARVREIPGKLLAGCGKKDFRHLLPLSYLSHRERRLRNEAIFYAGCAPLNAPLPAKLLFSAPS
jgi:hypothetical protein